MRARLLRAAAAALLAAATIAPAARASVQPPPIPAPATEDIYVDTCPITDADDSRGFDYERTATTVGAGITSARMTFIAQALEPCLDNGTIHDGGQKSWILVSLQGQVGPGNVFNFVQAGLGKLSNPGQTFFYASTCANDIGGCLSPASWVDFDNDGNMDTPVGGATYGVSISAYNATQQSGVPPDWYWRICFRQFSTNLVDCHNVQFSGGYHGTVATTDEAWWGCETGHSQNVLGRRDTSTQLWFYDTGYRYYGDSGSFTYTQTANSGITDPWSPNPSWYHFYHDQSGQLLGGVAGTDRTRCYTTNH